MMRRMKSDKSIISDLPDKIENNQFCALTKEQTAIYQSTVNQMMKAVEGESDNFSRQGLVLRMIMALKQICNHPIQYLKKGKPDIETGFVFDLKKLSILLHSKVIDKLDHKNINLDVDFMRGKIASTEVLAIAIWEEIESDIKKDGALLHCVKVVETENNFVEYYGKK